MIKLYISETEVKEFATTSDAVDFIVTNSIEWEHAERVEDVSERLVNACNEREAGTDKLHEKAVRAAEKYLEQHHCDILDTEFECFAGRVDIVAFDNKRYEIVFAEVRIGGLDKEAMRQTSKLSDEERAKKKHAP